MNKTIKPKSINFNTKKNVSRISQKKTKILRDKIRVSKNIYVLWIRHCESCSNISSVFNLVNKFLREPLCTKEGITNTINFKIEDIFDTNCLKYKWDGIKLYSSVLPRAIETSKLLSCGLYLRKREGIILNHEIVRLNFCQELANTIDKSINNLLSSTNVTTVDRSNKHCLMLNRLFKSGCAINATKIIGHNNNNNNFISSCSYKQYQYWISHILPILNPNCLNVITSHGTFIREAILNSKQHINNLDSFLIKYEITNNKCKKIKIIKKYIFENNLNNHNFQDILSSPDNIITKKLTDCKYNYDKDILNYI